jgi:hypothetical protein
VVILFYERFFQFSLMYNDKEDSSIYFASFCKMGNIREYNWVVKSTNHTSPTLIRVRPCFVGQE